MKQITAQSGKEETQYERQVTEATRVRFIVDMTNDCMHVPLQKRKYHFTKSATPVGEIILKLPVFSVLSLSPCLSESQCFLLCSQLPCFVQLTCCCCCFFFATTQKNIPFCTLVRQEQKQQRIGEVSHDRKDFTSAEALHLQQSSAAS